MRPIGFRHLRCFLEVARLGSVGGAADALEISQPAVSKTLRELEKRLGTPVFERSGRRLRLTEAGQLFQRHAGSAMIELERGVRALGRSGATQQRVVVGVLPTVATRIMPAAALAFGKAMPAASLRISTGPNWLLLSQLRDGSLDLVVGRLAAPEAMAGLVFEQLFLEPVAAVVRANHPLLADPTAGLESFPLILPPPGAIIRPLVEAYFLRLGKEVPQAPFEAVSLAIGRGILRGSDAVWFISRGVVSEELEAGSLGQLALDGMPSGGPVGLTRRAGTEPGPEVETLMRAVRQAAADGSTAARGLG